MSLYLHSIQTTILTDTRKVGGKSYDIFYAYDLADRIVGITYPDGRAVKYTRDSVGRIASAVLQSQGRNDHGWRKSCRDRKGAAGDKTLVSNVTYMPFGPVNGMTFGNGIASSFTYDLNYRLTGISSSVQRLGMGYNANDNITSIADALDATRNQSFTYDADDRLLTALGAYGGRGYGYDAVSNRTGESFSIGTETGTTAYAYPTNANRLASISGDESRAFTYDQAGNLLTDTAATDDDRKDYDGNKGWRGHGHKYGHDKNKHGNKPKDIESRAFTYDSRNRNTAVTIREGRSAPKTFRYAYNAMGQRVAKDGVHFIYDLSGNLIAERGNGGWKDYIYIDNLPIAMIDNNQTYYIHTDHLGSPQKVTDTRQKIVWERVAEPFGETMQILGPVIENRGRAPTRAPATITLNLRFPGQYHDEETGLDYNYFRSYDPTLGRYTQSDPIGLAGGLNTYGYVGQNPVNLTDPSGLLVLQSVGVGSALCLRFPKACASAIIGAAGILNNAINPPGSKSKQCTVSEQPQTTPAPTDPCQVDPDSAECQQAQSSKDKAEDTPQRPKGVPEDWVKQPGQKPGNTKWVDPKNPHNYVRQKPNGDLVQVRNGRTLDRFGNETSREDPQAHNIRPEDFIFRE